MSNNLRIRTLTDRFFDGETTLEEERELYDFYRQENLPDDLKAYRELFLDFDALRCPAELQQHFGKQTTTSRRVRRWLVAAAAVLALVLGGASLLFLQHEQSECIAIIYGERITDREVVLNEMQKTMTAMTDDGSDIVDEQLREMFGNE